MQLLHDQPYQKLTPTQPSSPKTPSQLPIPYRHHLIRFIILGMLSTVLLVNNYTFNNPQALQQTIQTQLNINQPKFNMLYSIVAFPNIIFALCIGIIIDYFGIRKSFIILTACLPLFQLLVAFGGMYRNYEMMLIGRLFFGLVFQSIDIAVSCYVVSWFIGMELGLALGMVATLPEFGNALNSYLTPIIYENTQKLAAPLFVSVGLCVVSFIFACLITYLDMKADETDIKNNIQVLTDPDPTSTKNETFKLQDLKTLNSTFWLVSILCMLSIAQYIPFLDNSNKLLQVRFCFSQVTAGQNITVTYIVVGMFGFPLGWFIDRVGYRRYFGVVGMVVFVVGHTVILLFPQCGGQGVVTQWSGASYGLLLLGIGFCFYADCLFPSIALVVKKRVTGTAFGIMEMLQNLAMAVYPAISASIVSHAPTQQQGYRLFSLFFVVTGLVGILVSCLLFFINDKDKKKLDASSTESKDEMIKIVRHLSWSDTQIYKNTQIPTFIRRFHSQKLIQDHYDSCPSSENQIDKQRKQFLIQMAKRRESLSRSEVKSKKGNQKIKNSKTDKKSSTMFEGDASGEDN